MLTVHGSLLHRDSTPSVGRASNGVGCHSRMRVGGRQEDSRPGAPGVSRPGRQLEVEVEGVVG